MSRRVEEYEWRDNLETALLWIRHLTYVHYMGQAFDPEHMRDLGNIAADALMGKRMPEYVPFEEWRETHQEEIEKWKALFEELPNLGDDDIDEN